MCNDIIAKAKSFWGSSNSSVLNRGCSDEELQKFKDKWGIQLPGDMQLMYREFNGFDQWRGAQDMNGFNLWPIDKIEDIHSLSSGHFSKTDDRELYVFADYLDFSWGYAFVPTGHLGATAVVMVGTASEERHVVTGSFIHFVDMLLRDDKGLYPV